MPDQHRLEEPRERDTVVKVFHCKICCEEFENEVEEFAENDVRCQRCDYEAFDGELEPGECALCGVTRDSGQVALGNWNIDGPLDMTCSSCVEELE